MHTQALPSPNNSCHLKKQMSLIGEKKIGSENQGRESLGARIGKFWRPLCAVPPHPCIGQGTFYGTSLIARKIFTSDLSKHMCPRPHDNLVAGASYTCTYTCTYTGFLLFSMAFPASIHCTEFTGLISQRRWHFTAAKFTTWWLKSSFIPSRK